MLEVTASDFRKHFGRFLDLVSDEPIGLRKSGRLTAVMLSIEEYEDFQRLKDSFLAAGKGAFNQHDNPWLDQVKAARLASELPKRSKETDDSSST